MPTLLNSVSRNCTFMTQDLGCHGCLNFMFGTRKQEWFGFFDLRWPLLSWVEGESVDVVHTTWEDLLFACHYCGHDNTMWVSVMKSCCTNVQFFLQVGGLKKNHFSFFVPFVSWLPALFSVAARTLVSFSEHSDQTYFILLDVQRQWFSVEMGIN